MPSCTFFLTVLFCFQAAAIDLSPVGVWRTIDDTTHKPRSLIRLYEQDGEIFGRIEAGLVPGEAQEVCSKCGGERKDKPIVGMVILRHMKKQGREFSGGDILDPESGWVYRCRFTVQPDGKTIVIRGFLGVSLLGRSQTWYREE